MNYFKGYTIIEALMAALIFAGILFAIGDLFLTHQNSYFRTSTQLNTQRLVAVLTDEISRRIRPAIYVAAGSNVLSGSSVLLPPYNPIQSGSVIDNFISLAYDPFGQNQNRITIQFYRTLSNNGGKVYIYSGAHLAPPPSVARTYGSESSTALEDLELWYQRNLVALRLSVRDSLGNLEQNNAVAYVRFYN